MTLFAAEVATGLRIASVLGGLAGGLVAVYLAQVIPHRMGVTTKYRPNLWWGIAVCVGVGFGWFAASVGWSLLPWC